MHTHLKSALLASAAAIAIAFPGWATVSGDAPL
jgi:hypothetical protein